MHRQMWNLWKPPVIHCSSKLNEIIKLLLEHSQQASNVLFNYIRVIHHLSTPIAGHLSIRWFTAGCCKYHHYLINTLSICTPLDSLCPYPSFIFSLPSTWQKGISGCCLMAAAAFGHICPASVPSPLSPFSLQRNHKATSAHDSPKGMELDQENWHLEKRQSSDDIKKEWKGDTVFLSMEIEPLLGKHQQSLGARKIAWMFLIPHVVQVVPCGREFLFSLLSCWRSWNQAHSVEWKYLRLLIKSCLKCRNLPSMSAE